MSGMDRRMSKEPKLEQLARRLAEGAAAGDWQAVAELDQEIAEFLRGLRQRRQWSSFERIAFEQLRVAHAQARECCERESQRVGEQLAQLRAHKDAWIAYGMNQELNESRT